jgi:hypothetical protein
MDLGGGPRYHSQEVIKAQMNLYPYFPTEWGSTQEMVSNLYL